MAIGHDLYYYKQRLMHLRFLRSSAVEAIFNFLIILIESMSRIKRRWGSKGINLSIDNFRVQLCSTAKPEKSEGFDLDATH